MDTHYENEAILIFLMINYLQIILLYNECLHLVTEKSENKMIHLIVMLKFHSRYISKTKYKYLMKNDYITTHNYILQ